MARASYGPTQKTYMRVGNPVPVACALSYVIAPSRQSARGDSAREARVCVSGETNNTFRTSTRPP